MSCLDSVVQVMIVPNDLSKPLVGPLALAHGGSEKAHKMAAHKLGYKEGEYIFRRWISLDEAIGPEGS